MAKTDIRPGHCFDRRGPSPTARRDSERSNLVRKYEPSQVATKRPENKAK